MSTPRVSIVLATRDQAPWLPATLKSVEAQTLADWELLLVDDGSTDATPDIARAAAARDPRVRHLPGPHRERAVARNRGIAAAAADLIAFLDGDDLWTPTKLARQVAALEASPDAGLCFTTTRYVDPAGAPLPIRRPPTPIDGRIFPALVRCNRIILSSVVVRRAILAETGGFDETLAPLGCEDWDLWLRIARRHPVTIVTDELTQYRVHPGNTTLAAVLASGVAVLAKHFADPDTARAAGVSHATALAELHWYHAGAAAAGGDHPRARRLARRAFATTPHTVFTRPAIGALARLVLPERMLRLLA